MQITSICISGGQLLPSTKEKVLSLQLLNGYVVLLIWMNDINTFTFAKFVHQCFWMSQQLPILWNGTLLFHDMEFKCWFYFQFFIACTCLLLFLFKNKTVQIGVSAPPNHIDLFVEYNNEGWQSFIKISTAIIVTILLAAFLYEFLNLLKPNFRQNES